MKYLFLLILLLFLFFLLYLLFKRQLVICRIRNMDPCWKAGWLNNLLEPFGFSYLPERDILTSVVHGWQRKYGYTAFFDDNSHHFQMVFDCEPIYFDHGGKTWLIEFWKGQYGINTGCEIGVYYADSIVDPKNRRETLFRSAADPDMLPMEAALFRGRELLFTVSGTHWWLTGFRMGLFSHPEELGMYVSITFPDCSMMQSFLGGLTEAGYPLRRLRISGSQVRFLISSPYSEQPRLSHRFSAAFAQWKNRQFCHLFAAASRPFRTTADRLLYFYLLLPRVFRRILRLHRFGKEKSGKRR